MPHIAISLPKGELESQVVEGRTKILEAVTCDNANTREERDQIGHVVDIEDIVAGVGLAFGSDSWTVYFDRKRLLNVALQAISVFLGPLNLGPNAIK
jgi:hypothetical protein